MSVRNGSSTCSRNPASTIAWYSVRSPEVEFLIETRDLEHTEALVQALKASGVKVATWF